MTSEIVKAFKLAKREKFMILQEEVKLQRKEKLKPKPGMSNTRKKKGKKSLGKMSTKVYEKFH